MKRFSQISPQYREAFNEQKVKEPFCGPCGGGKKRDMGDYEPEQPVPSNGKKPTWALTPAERAIGVL